MFHATAPLFALLLASLLAPLPAASSNQDSSRLVRIDYEISPGAGQPAIRESVRVVVPPSGAVDAPLTLTTPHAYQKSCSQSGDGPARCKEGRYETGFSAVARLSHDGAGETRGVLEMESVSEPMEPETFEAGNLRIHLPSLSVRRASGQNLSEGVNHFVLGGAKIQVTMTVLGLDTK